MPSPFLLRMKRIDLASFSHRCTKRDSQPIMSVARMSPKQKPSVLTLARKIL